MKKLQQFNIFAFNFDRLKNNNFNLTLTPFEAERNEELIALADNECLRAIRRITNHRFNVGGEDRLEALFEERKQLTKQKNSVQNRRRIADINNEIRELLYIPEYVCVQFPNKMKKSDYNKINKNGFFINGKKYKWLLCGAGHQRTNRAFYCEVSIFDELYEHLNCGARKIPILLPKYNAYIALSSSASYVVSAPRVCVIPDCEIKMTKKVDWVEQKSEDEYSINRIDKELGFNLFDGMGVVSPEMASKWCQELDISYLPSCWGIRSAFVKGMVCVIDFHKFSEEVAHSKIIKDVYGNEHNVDKIDMIITKSQFKLWNAYDNWEQYLENQQKYGWSWGITKVSPEKDVDWVLANYQYIQVLKASDEDIKELCSETEQWIKNISTGNDYGFKLLYLLGKLSKNLDSNNLWNRVQDNSIKSLMLEQYLVNDDYLTTRVVNSIRKKIKQTMLGKIIIRGNYQIRISDPYALLEWAFGMEVKGLLNEGEDYMWYWNQLGVNEVVAMRSPLTWKSEAHILKLMNTGKMKEWYKYLTSGIVYNVWGCDCMLESDGDFDLDCSCTTNNKIFLKGVIK